MQERQIKACLYATKRYRKDESKWIQETRKLLLSKYNRYCTKNTVLFTIIAGRRKKFMKLLDLCGVQTVEISDVGDIYYL